MNLEDINPRLKEQMRDLSTSLKKPFYLYDSIEIRNTCKKFINIPYTHKSINFASMANAHPQFLRIIKEEGLNIFVNSIIHLESALQLGFKGGEIVYTASAMDEETMRRVHSSGAMLNLDSIGQLKQWKKLYPNAPAGIRCNIGDLVEPRDTLGGYFLGKKSRLGLSLDEIDQFKMDPLIEGLHLYAGTNILDIDYFLDCYQHIINLGQKFPNLRYLDFGGGFGLPENPSDEFQMDLYGNIVTELMDRISGGLGRQVLLILEPGRIIGGQAGYFICKAIDKKIRGDLQLIGVNASSVQFPRPLFYSDKAYHPVSVLPQKNDTPHSDKITTSIYGCSTYSRDFLAQKVMLAEVFEGDLIIFGYAGSYCATAFTHFLGFPKPEEIFI